MIYECNGSFFADEVDREFGDNLVVPVVGLVTVYPANDYVRQHGRNLTPRALDGACAHDNVNPISGVCYGCHSVVAFTPRR